MAMLSSMRTPGRKRLSRFVLSCAALAASCSHSVTLRPARAQVSASAVPQAPAPMTAMWLKAMVVTEISPRSSFGTSPTSPAASRMNRRLRSGQPIDQAEADVARQAQHIGAVGEQPVEPVGGEPHRHGVEAPPALVALQHVGRARIEPEPRRIDDHLGERGDVL